MKRTKRMLALLLTMAVMIAAASSAFALPAGGLAPVKSTYYHKSQDGTWKAGTVRTYSYKGDGRLTKVTYLYTDGDRSSTSYSWKGNYITKVSYSDGDYSQYKYKGSKRTAIVNVDLNQKKVYKIKWKKNKGTYTTDDTAHTIKVNAKGQIVATKTAYSDGLIYNYTYKYYGNGNRKSYTAKSNKGYSRSVKYNSKGYVTSEKVTSGGSSYSYTYKYTYKKGKLVEKLVKYKEGSEISEYKYVYTKWKKVSHLRNCDAYGYAVTMG